MSIEKMNMCGSFDDLYRNLCMGFGYGFIRNGKKYKDKNLDFDKYRTLSPNEFIKHHIGICWDYAEFEYLYISKFFPELKPQIWYIEHSDESGDRPTHTWVSFHDDGMIKVMEVSWLSNRGIHSYKSEKDMVDDYARKHCKGKNYVIFKIEPVKKYGLSCDEYMSHVWETGKCVRKVGHVIPYKKGGEIMESTNDDLKKYSPKIQRERLRHQARLLQQKYKKNLDVLWNMKDTQHDDYKAISKLEDENDDLFRKIENIYDDINDIEDDDE